MKPTHARRTTTRQVSRAALITTVLGLSLAGSAGPAFAGRPGGGTTTPGTVTCSATPNPVAWNTDFQLAVRGLAAGALVDVQITDSNSVENWNLMADASGVAATTSHAYWRGTSTVKVIQGSARKAQVVATCSFNVV